MSAELSYLYDQIHSKYDIRLCTTSFFNKTVDWIHNVDDKEFSYLLHGNELIFNSGTRYTSDEWLFEYIESLYKANASGLFLSLRAGKKFPPAIIDYCNEHQFPLFSTAWDVPFIDVMRTFSEILLKNEQNETNLTSALKQAIYYPQNTDMYLPTFEHNGLYRDLTYTIAIISCHEYNTLNGNEVLDSLEKSLKNKTRRTVSYQQEGILVVLYIGYEPILIKEELQNLSKNDPNIYAGIGSIASHVSEIYKSYNDAYKTYEITKTTIPKNILLDSELGIYKLLTNVQDEQICISYAKDVLEKLHDYDKKHLTDYMDILKSFFEHDCNVVKTSMALYCHKNTLNYKIKAIREILGFDITENEHRMRIMVALHIWNLYNL